MEKDEKEFFEKVLTSDPRLKDLYNQHMQLDKEVRKYSRYAPVSNFALRRQNELKRRKLKTKDSMQQILNSYRGIAATQ